MVASKSWRSPDLPLQLVQFLSARAALAGRLCIGLSGGRDSVALLHAAASLQLGERLSALHVHHGLSPRADAWEAHCRRLCDDLRVPLRVVRVQVRHDSGLGLEAAARQARYQAFADCDADFLLLAHHLGDLAETVLFNLIRGSGVTGAAGMPIERPLGRLRLLRPWRDVAPEAIAAYAGAQALEWVEDESNDDTGFSRNFLRHEILPRLRARFPAVLPSLGAAAGHFAEADGLLAELAELDWQSTCRGEGLPMPAVRQLSTARLKNLLRWRLRHLGWQVPVAARLDEFARQLLSAGPDRHPGLSLPEGEMRVQGGCLQFLTL